MRKASALAGAFLFILSCTVSQQQPSQRPSQQPTTRPSSATGGLVIVELAKGGTFSFLLRPDKAPATVANFIQKAKDHKYDGLRFHRVEDWVVQGGDPQGTGTGGGKMPSEYNDLPFLVGSVGIARGGDPKINNDMQWFVTKKDASWLNQQYTNFGQVQSGMDVVMKIAIGDVIKTIRIEDR
jgi:cyclophilin family peptidyl-prolyl cis-trans isomerase